MNRLKIYLSIIFEKEIFIKAIKVAIVVGTILNIINQGDKIFALAFDQIDHLKSLLTYCVPYLVSTYTALTMKLKFKIGDVSPIEVDLKCKHCKEHIHIKKNELVPLCKKCKEKTKWRIK